MQVIIDNWYGYQVRGVNIFDTETCRVSQMITQDDDDPRKDNPCDLPIATPDQHKAYRKAINQVWVGDVIEITTGRKHIGTKGVVVDKFNFTPRGTYGHGTISYTVLACGAKVQSKHCTILEANEGEE